MQRKSKRFTLLITSLILSILLTSEKSLAVSTTTDFIYDLAGGRANWTNGQAFGDFSILDGGSTDTSAMTHSDMYDGGMMFDVCASASCAADGAFTQYTGTGTANSSTGYYTGATKLTSSLSVTASYRFSKTIAAGRMLVQLENTTASDITKQVRVRTNLGSDGVSYLKYQSSTSATLANHYSYSATAYTSSSYWFITSDQSSLTSTTTGSDPVASFIFGKSGATVSPTTMFKNDDMYTMFTVTIPANTSRYMMFAFGMGGINPLNNTLIGAYTGVTTYLTDFANWPSDLTSDLTAGQISGLLNWVVAPSVTSFVPRAAYSKTGASTYDLTFSEAVTGLTTGDFTFSGTATGCSVSSVSGSGSVYVVETTGCAEGNSVLTLTSNSITGTQSGPLSNSSASSVSVDLTAPTISTVTAPANATYLPANSLSFTLSTSETVTVTGSPRISLTLGVTTRYATYSSGSNTKTLIFSYTIPADLADLDLDGISVTSPLSLNSGTISDLAGNAMTALTFTPPTTTGVLISQAPAAPTINSITANNSSVSVNFTAGSSNGSAITNYKYSVNNGSSFTAFSPTSTTSPLTIPGLSNGVTYQILIKAVTAAGDGSASNVVSSAPTSFASISVALTASSTIAYIGTRIVITATVGQAGKVNFYWNSKKIPGCIQRVATVSATCNWKPNVRGIWNINAVLYPTNNSYSVSTSNPVAIQILSRVGARN